MRSRFFFLALLVAVVAVHLLKLEILMLTCNSNPNEGFALARQQSFGFFTDITDAQWKLMQRNVQSESMFHRPSTPELHSNNPALWMLANVDPLFSCIYKKRILGRGDGPKWVCDPHRLNERDDCLIYSIGSAGKYQFEDGIVSYLGGPKCEIHVFDPNPRYARVGDPEKKNIHYHAWGLTSSYQRRNSEYKTIFEIVKELGHEGRRIDIFKIDCEGCEWTSYKDWLNPTIDIQQLLIEIHAGNNRFGTNLSSFFLDFINRGFLPFSKEANTHPAAHPAGTLFEYGFIRLNTTFLGHRMK